MKICVIGPSKYFFSGVTAHTIFLANALSKQNNVSVILLRKLLPEILYPGKKHLNNQNYTINFFKNIDVYDGMDWCSPRSWLSAFRFIKHKHPCAIIMLWWTSSVSHMLLLLVIINRLFIGSKLIIEMHEILDPLEERVLPIKIYARIMRKLILQNADAITVHSNPIKTQIANTLGINKQKIFVKPFGAYEDYKRYYDRDLLQSTLHIEEKFIILSFGSIRRYKGIPYMVKAFSALPESIALNSRLIIVGEDWGEENELYDLILASPYRDKITFIPHFVSDEMIPKYFSIADVIVLPYLQTCGSGVASISMTYGKPIIATEIETMKGFLNGYDGAFFTPLRDSIAISILYQELYKKKQSEGIPVYAFPQASWHEIAMQYENIIKMSDKI